MPHDEAYDDVRHNVACLKTVYTKTSNLLSDSVRRHDTDNNWCSWVSGDCGRRRAKKTKTTTKMVEKQNDLTRE
jgi:hypothetical protein